MEIMDNEDILQMLVQVISDLNHIEWITREDCGVMNEYLNVSFGKADVLGEYTTDIKSILKRTGVFDDDEMVTMKWLFDIGESINDMHALIVFLDRKILNVIDKDMAATTK
jgi:hypothetical protein